MLRPDDQVAEIEPFDAEGHTMQATTLQALVEGARAYEQLFVPALFGQWNQQIADSSEIQPGQQVLDVACGTGVRARQLAEDVGPNGQVTGADPNLGMLAVAKEQAPEIEWREAPAESLPFSDDLYDAVASQFGLMFFQDRPQAITEMMRVLKPAGRMTVAVWDAVENQSGFSVQLNLIERLAGQSAADASRAPFALGNREALETLFVDAGAAPSQVRTVPGHAKFPSVQTMVGAELRGWLPVMDVHLSEAVIQEVLAEAEAALSPYTTDQGEVIFDVKAHLVTAVKP